MIAVCCPSSCDQLSVSSQLNKLRSEELGATDMVGEGEWVAENPEPALTFHVPSE